MTKEQTRQYLLDNGIPVEDGPRGELILRNADLRDMNLFGADFSGADLRFADLRGANLSKIHFDYDTRWRGAFIDEDTIFDRELYYPDFAFITQFTVLSSE